MSETSKNYEDVNRNDYLKAMYCELVGQKAMISFTEKAKIIHEFVLGNATNSDAKLGQKLSMIEVDSSKVELYDEKGRARTKEGGYFIPKREWSKKNAKKIAKIKKTAIA